MKAPCVDIRASYAEGRDGAGPRPRSVTRVYANPRYFSRLSFATCGNPASLILV